MELFDMELEKAGRLIEATGRDRNDFAFRQRHLPPDPDDAVMFTARYAVTVSMRLQAIRSKRSAALASIGCGISNALLLRAILTEWSSKR